MNFAGSRSAGDKTDSLGQQHEAFVRLPLAFVKFIENRPQCFTEVGVWHLFPTTQVREAGREIYYSLFRLLKFIGNSKAFFAARSASLVLVKSVKGIQLRDYGCFRSLRVQLNGDPSSVVAPQRLKC